MNMVFILAKTLVKVLKFGYFYEIFTRLRFMKAIRILTNFIFASIEKVKFFFK